MDAKKRRGEIKGFTPICLHLKLLFSACKHKCNYEGKHIVSKVEVTFRAGDRNDALEKMTRKKYDFFPAILISRS
jgi:hypothetical protein